MSFETCHIQKVINEHICITPWLVRHPFH